jgi:hydroxymethylbilane synthase
LNGNGVGLDALVEGARIGTSSARRQSQLRAYRADLQISDLRGNVGTRLNKLAAGDFDAIVLARAGLVRLGINQPHIALPFEICLPAIGQGAIGVQCRQEDTEVRDLMAAFDHAETAHCVQAERALNRALGGGCQLPIAGLARSHGRVLKLTARVARLDGSELIEASAESNGDPGALGELVAERLLAQGADRVLASVR